MLADFIKEARTKGVSDDEIAGFISQKDQEFASNLQASRERGVSPKDVLDFIAGPKDRSSPVDPSYLKDQFMGGLGERISGYGNTAGKLGADPATAQRAIELGQAVSGGPNRESAGNRFFNPKPDDVQVGGFGLGSIPGAIAESAAGMLVDAGAMVGGGAVAGPAGAIALPLASYGLAEYGNRLDKRVSNQGGAPATPEDQLAAAGTVGFEAALNRVGLGSILKKVGIGGRTIADGGKRVLAATGAEGITEGAQNVVEQVGTSAGTQRGLNVDGREVLGNAILGGAAGGGMRVAGEVGVQARNATDAYNTRDIMFPEEAANLASGVSRISEANKRKIGNAKDDTASLDDYEARLEVMRDAPTKRAVTELDKMLANGDISTEDHGAAISALTKRPTTEGIKVAERLIGGMGEGADAISFAKQSAIIGQLKERGGYSKDGVVKGGIGAKAERLLGEARAAIATAGLGALSYAGYKGLGTFSATMASIQNAAPAAAALGGTYLAMKALDKIAGTNSPTAQVMRRFGEKGNPVNMPSEGLPTYADIDEAERLTREQSVTEANARRQQARDQQAYGSLMNERARAYAAQNSADAQDAALIKREDADTKKAARYSASLAKARQKLDLMRGVVNDPSTYNVQPDPTMTAAAIKETLDRVNAEIATETIKSKAAKATPKGTETPPQPQAQTPQTRGPQAQAAPQGTGLLSGPSKSESDTPPTKPDVNDSETKAIKAKARIFKSFRERVKKLDNPPDSMIDDFQRLNGDINNYKEARQFINQMIKKYPEHEAFIRTFWLSDIDQPNIKQNLGKIFVFNDGDGPKIIMTRKQADKRSGR